LGGKAQRISNVSFADQRLCLPKDLGHPDRMSANGNPGVRERREALGWTQPELAAAAGLSDETVRKAEQGKYVSAKSLRLIEEALLAGDRSTARSALAGVSGEGATVTPSVERPERNVVRISAQAIGWELSATYTDAEDRVHALEDIAKAWAAMMGGSGGIGGSSSEDGPGTGSS
jgi:transcriptional regulator with XRE-family HTH domain